MGGTRPAETLGMEPGFAGETDSGADTGEPIGMNGGESATIKATKKSWDTSKPVTGPGDKVKGKTVAEVRASLDTLPEEWGRGGASFSVSLEWHGDGTVTAIVKATFYRILPNWVDKAKADTEAKNLWAKMIKRLEKHEQRHMDFGVAAAKWLAAELVGLTVDDIQGTQDAAVEQMNSEHETLDDESDHGKDPDHDYGGVVF